MRDYDSEAMPEFIDVTRDTIISYLTLHENRPDILKLDDLSLFREWIDEAHAAARAPNHDAWDAIVERGLACCKKIAAAKCKATTGMSGGYREERKTELLNEFRYVIRTFELRIFMQGIKEFHESALGAAEFSEVRGSIDRLFRSVREKRLWRKELATSIRSPLRRIAGRSESEEAANRLLLALERIEKMCDKPREKTVTRDSTRRYHFSDLGVTALDLV